MKFNKKLLSLACAALITSGSSKAFSPSDILSWGGATTLATAATVVIGAKQAGLLDRGVTVTRSSKVQERYSSTAIATVVTAVVAAKWKNLLPFGL